MPPLMCADTNNTNNHLLACSNYVPAASMATSEASLLTFAQQFLHQQQHQQHFNNNVNNINKPFNYSINPSTSKSGLYEYSNNSNNININCNNLNYAVASPAINPASCSAMDQQWPTSSSLPQQQSNFCAGDIFPPAGLNFDQQSISAVTSSVPAAYNDSGSFNCNYNYNYSSSFPQDLQGSAVTTADHGLPNADNCFGDAMTVADHQWMMECLMYDGGGGGTGIDGGFMMSCFDNPCESTQSSEPATSSCYNPACSTPLDEALPDGFTVMEEVRRCAAAASADATAAVAVSTLPWPREEVMPVPTAPGASYNTSSWVQGGSASKRARVLGGGGISATSSPEKSAPPSHGIQLLQMLLECAKAVDFDPARAAELLPELKSQCTRYGDPIQRLAWYFTEALSQRHRSAAASISTDDEEASPSSTAPAPTPTRGSERDITLAYKTMNEACPYFPFAHFTANQAILEAVDGAERVHIVDFGLKEGAQWASMLQAIAETKNPSNRRPSVRITGVPSADETAGSAAAAARRLSEFGRALQLDVDVRITDLAMSDWRELTAEAIGVAEGEAVAVNFMQELCHLLDGEGNEGVRRMLNVAAELSPRVVTVAEMDAALDEGPFQRRFVSALHFFSAMFDSMEVGMRRDSGQRALMEQRLLGERILSMVGEVAVPRRRRRLRLQSHQPFWRSAFGAAGLVAAPLSPFALSQARILLWRFCDSFSLNQHSPGSLTLGWQNKPLLTVSCWTLAPPSSSS